MRHLSVLAIFLSALFLSPACMAQQNIPIKDWIRYPAFGHVTISPNGKYLAVATAEKNHIYSYQLAIISTDSLIKGHPRIVAHYGLSNYQTFANIFWVNDKRIAAATAGKRGGFNRPGRTGKLFAINVNGGQQKNLMGYSSGHYFLGLLSLLPENKRAIIVQTTTGANWLDVYTGSTHSVARSPVHHDRLVADHNGKVRLAAGNNGMSGKPEFFYRPPGKLDWKNISGIFTHNRMADASLMPGGPVMFTPDNKGMYYETWADNSAQTMGLYTYNFKTGRKKLLYNNPKVDIGGVIRSFDRKSIVGVYIEPGKPETLALNTKAPKIQLLAELEHMFPNKQVNIKNSTRTGNAAIVYTWGDNSGGTYYLYSSNPKPQLTPLFKQTPWLKSSDISPTHPIKFKSRDGLTIHGYLTVPRGMKAKNLPMVVYVHGGPHGIRTDWGFDPNDFDSIAEQILANHGYAVLSLNFRGSGGYGMKFMGAGFRHWGSTMQNDLADGVKWAIKQGFANPHRVCIFGASYGGYASLMSAERFPDLYQCAIGYDGLYDLALWESRDSDTARSAGGRLYQKTVLGHNKKQLKAFSPAFHADRLKIPVFLLQGGRDQRAPVGGYKEMVSAIKKHGTPLKTLFEENEGHGFYKPVHRIKAWKEILAFIDKYIGSGQRKEAAAL